MPKSLPPPPPRPPQRATSHYSKSRFRSCKDSSLGSKKMTGLPPKDKRTRNLPKFSDCHGCGVRIDYSNPKERLQLLQSFWRIVLLCRDCRKMVNSGQLCPYCFKDTLDSVSDCVRCCDCQRFIHQNCIVNYSASPPWSYSSSSSCKESGLGFSRCVDCWVPNLLKNSVKVCRKKGITDKSGELPATQSDPMASIKGKDDLKSLEEVVNNSNTMVENNIAVAVKAKEKALRKAVVAKNAVLLASNALDLVAKEYSSKKDEGLVECINNDSNVNELTRFVDDAELAFQLHRAMNSSPRISKNSCPTNHSYPDLLKLTGSDGASPVLNDLGNCEDGKVAACSDPLTKDNHDSNIMEASAYIRINECLSAISSLRLIPQLKTYKRINKKRKDFQENENGDIGTPIDVAGKCTVGNDRKIVAEPQSSQSDEHKQVSQANEARTSSPESCYTNIFTENWSGNRRPEHYAIKYKRITGCRMSSYKEVFRRHEEANLDGLSFKKETHASSPGLPMNCSKECGTLSDNSLQSCVVNLQVCASIGVSSQEEG